MLREELKEKRRQILDIARRNGARSIRVFGSIAKGEACEHSDWKYSRLYGTLQK